MLDPWPCQLEDFSLCKLLAMLKNGIVSGLFSVEIQLSTFGLVMPLSGRLRALFWQVPTGCEVPFNFLFDWLPWAPCYKPGFVLVVVLWTLSSFSSSVLEVWVQVLNLTLPSAVPAQGLKITGPFCWYVTSLVCGAKHHGPALRAHVGLIMPLTSASPVGLVCLKSFHAPVSLICQASL